MPRVDMLSVHVGLVHFCRSISPFSASSAKETDAASVEKNTDTSTKVTAIDAVKTKATTKARASIVKDMSRSVANTNASTQVDALETPTWAAPKDLTSNVALFARGGGGEDNGDITTQVTTGTSMTGNNHKQDEDEDSDNLFCSDDEEPSKKKEPQHQRPVGAAYLNDPLAHDFFDSDNEEDTTPPPKPIPILRKPAPILRKPAIAEREIEKAKLLEARENKIKGWLTPKKQIDLTTQQNALARKKAAAPTATQMAHQLAQKKPAPHPMQNGRAHESTPDTAH